MQKLLLAAVLCTASLHAASAQFSPSFLQNNSYWGDGKAEFDIYDAQIVRAGQPRHCEMTLILMRDAITPELSVSSTPAPKAGPVNGIRMSQMFTAPLGVSTEQQSLSIFWILNGDLLQASLVTARGRGNRVIKAERISEIKGISFEVQDENGESRGTETYMEKGIMVLNDELPLRVRTIEFSKTAGEFEIQLAAPMAGAPSLNPAKISYKVNPRSIEVDVRQGNGLDHFLLDPEFPFLLREWKARDGSHFKLKRSLKVAYENYTKAGDRERALADPMLRHSD